MGVALPVCVALLVCVALQVSVALLVGVALLEDVAQPLGAPSGGVTPAGRAGPGSPPQCTAP